MNVRPTTVKNIDEYTWLRFKIICLTKNIQMGIQLKDLITEFVKKEDKEEKELLKRGKK